MGRHKTRFCAAHHDKDAVGRYPDGACRVCVISRSKDRWANSPSYVRNQTYKRLYGISLEQYDGMLKKQDYRCAICRQHMSEFVKALSVDHNHTTGDVRGLLCQKCNTRLGVYEDELFMTLCKNYLGASNVRV